MLTKDMPNILQMYFYSAIDKKYPFEVNWLSAIGEGLISDINDIFDMRRMLFKAGFYPQLIEVEPERIKDYLKGKFWLHQEMWRPKSYYENGIVEQNEKAILDMNLEKIRKEDKSESNHQ